jgi:GAF domain-containing protein
MSARPFPPEQEERNRALADEHAALRRVATLVAQGVPPEEVFAAVTEELGRLLSVEYASLGRYESDGTVTIVAGAGSRDDHTSAGRRWSLGGKNITTLVSETGSPARIDSYADASGPLGATAREDGVGSGVGTPVIVEGRLWGVMAALSPLGQPLPADTEARLGSFTGLVATAIANAESRAGLARLAEEQVALRRVATLVAQGVPPEEVFAAVIEEVGRLLPVDIANLCRYESDGSTTVVATWGRGDLRFPVGGRWPLGGQNLGTLVFETGRAARIENYADASGPLSVTAREGGLRSAVATPIIVEGRLWGMMLAGSSLDQPLPPDTEARLGSFTELVATAIANAEGRAGLARLAAEQAALRRVATLVAQGVHPEAVFATVTEEVGRLLDTDLAGMASYESDDTVTVVATWAAEGEVTSAHPLVPGPWPLEGGDVASTISRTGRPVRIDDYEDVPGHIAAFVRDELGVRASVGSPIVVEGRLWGILFVHSKDVQEPLPGDTESRLTGFTELVATAVANTQARAEVGRLAREQAALRRVATLVAREASPAEVFSTVTEEVGRLLDADIAAMIRLEPGNTAIVVARWSEGDEGDHVPVGTVIPLEGDNVATMVLRTGRPARRAHPELASGPVGELVRRLGVTSTVGTPIVVEGRLWGGMSVSSRQPEPLPIDTESRIAHFAELVATAIANAEARTELAASRARVVAAADETRRRVERDLHDGVQQRLVTLGLVLRAAEAELPEDLEEVRAELSHIGEGLKAVLDELREISRGIHPAILSEGGLAPALKTLARRSPIPVALDIRFKGRLPDGVEVAAYYVVSEVLTNTAKHAQASVVYIDVARTGGALHISVRDDGVGGADPARGSGLVGLSDRVEALGGTIVIKSAKGAGTTAEVRLPLDRTREASEQVHHASVPYVTMNPH